MTRTWFVRTLAPLVLVAVVLAGCSSDDSSGTTAPAGGTDTSTGDGDPGIFGSAECAQAVTAWGAAVAAAGAAQGTGAGDLEASLGQLQAVASSAPEEIRGDLTTVYEAYATFLGALQEAGYDPTSGAAPTAEQLAAMQSASEALQDTEVEAASQRVSAWFESNCGS